MKGLKSWLPIVKPKPFSTFPKRLIKKWAFIKDSVLILKFQSIRSKGANFVGLSPNGNALLSLNGDYALGKKGTIIELPRDYVIYEEVQRKGSWELEESEFLSHRLKKLSQTPAEKIAILDIGANTGLVTLQALNISKSKPDIFMFEPISEHVVALEHNLSGHNNVYINNFALSDHNGSTEIFTQSTNHGNTSVFKSLVPVSERITSVIELKDTEEYCTKFLEEYDGFVIKCDTQGMDALILARIPEAIWDKVDSSVIEVWALPVITKEDVTILLPRISKFKHKSWHSSFEKEVEVSEIESFWLSNSGESKNLFLSR